MTDRTELLQLRIALARIAQATRDPAIEREIPGCEGQTMLGFQDLFVLAKKHKRGWNRLAGLIVDHVLPPLD